MPNNATAKATVNRSDLWNRPSKVAIVLAVAVAGCAAVALFFVPHDSSWVHAPALGVAIAVAVLFGLFTIGSYIVARRVESLIRIPIKDYYDFLRQAKEVLQDRPSTVKIMVWYPCFSLTHDVKFKAGGGNMDVLLHEMLDDKGVEVKVLMNDKERRDAFVENMAGMCQRVGVRYDRKQGWTVINRFKDYSARSETDPEAGHNCALVYANDELPFHLFWSPRYMVFSALPDVEDYTKGPHLPCKGFESRDADIIEAFGMIFDEYFGRGEPEELDPPIAEEEVGTATESEAPSPPGEPGKAGEPEGGIGKGGEPEAAGGEGSPPPIGDQEPGETASDEDATT